MIRYERAPLSNPNYEARGNWMYYPEGSWEKTDEFKANFPTYNKESHTDMPDGEKVIYKYHICPALGDYLDRTRKIISNFLYENKIMHKTVGTNPWSDGLNSFEANIVNENSTQYGKSFTVYTGTLEEFYIIAKGMTELVKQYDIKGIPPEKFAAIGSNMQYEYPVPGTNNVLYYTVEKATYNAVYKSLVTLKPEWIDMKTAPPTYDKNGEVKMRLSWDDGQFGVIGGEIGKKKDRNNVLYNIDGEPAMYLASDRGAGYALRQLVMTYYLGFGPMDFLVFEEDLADYFKIDGEDESDRLLDKEEDKTKPLETAEEEPEILSAKDALNIIRNNDAAPRWWNP